MTSPAPLTVAIIGSGPSGCYLALSLLRALPEVEITMIDRHPVPYGLVRYGVAADHQHTKTITRQFERLFQNPAVRFAGDLEVGRDLTLEDLRAQFDVVVLATGLFTDRELEVPGADLPGVIGAGEIVRALNGYPGAARLLGELGDDVVIVGAGNVALDILRFLVKSADEYSQSDVDDEALQAYLAAPAAHVTLLSRSGAADSKGDPQMIKELAGLPRARYRITPDLPDPASAEDRTRTARVTAIGALTDPARSSTAGPDVTLHFGASPIRVLGTERVSGVEIATESGEVTVPATSVITAIGFVSDASGEFEALTRRPSESGRMEPGLYRTGWAKRGPRGAIPENRACAKSVAEEIVADVRAGTIPATQGTLGFAGLPDEVRARAVDYEQWLVLDAHERESAAPDRVRRKVTDHHRMVSIARGDA